MTESDRDKTLELARVLHRAGVDDALETARIVFAHLHASGRAVVPVAHLDPFAKYYRSRMAVQMRGMDDCIHAIHRGTEYEAEISVTDCGRLAAALPASPYGKAFQPMGSEKEKDDE